MQKAPAKRVLLITPPMVQLNTPYPATPVLTGLLKENGVEAVQADLSLALALALFSPDGVAMAIRCAHRVASPSATLAFFLEHAEVYENRICMVVAFLQGRSPECAWLIARPGFLPEGPHFRELDPSEEGLAEETLDASFGALGIQDKAKLLASLFLDDLADVFREAVDPLFGFSKYGEHLAVAAPSFDPIRDRVENPMPTEIDALLDRLTINLLDRHRPDFVGVTAPFPGTVYGAFRVAACVRRHRPETHLVLGGGYVNSELRDFDDPRVFDYFDTVCFDEGFDPWLGIVGVQPRQRIRTLEGFSPALPKPAAPYRVHVSDYTGLDFGQYLSLLETTNPMHRLWSDGHWLKVQLAHGCYWHRCAFCDVALDYVNAFSPADPVQAVDALLQMKRDTGIQAFHFTDEALPPALLGAICDELLRRSESLVWWGNIRLDNAFTDALVEKMSRAGCIAVSAGLECANDRLLKLMNKGITLASARRTCQRLADNAILVHTYLMYGFPTQTKEETVGALEFVRRLYADGIIQSSYWHRFALTVHSPIARDSERFNIAIAPMLAECPRFALNEIPYTEPTAPDLDQIGHVLRIANYNLSRGVGLDIPARDWFKMA